MESGNNTMIIQLTVDGVITETGQNVQLNVEQEQKPEPGLVLTQLQLMVVQIVLGRRLKLRNVTHSLVQVNIVHIGIVVTLTRSTASG